MAGNRRVILGALAAALPAIAEAKKAKHDKKRHAPKHKHKHHDTPELPPVDDITDPVVVEPDPTPTPEATMRAPRKKRRDRVQSSALATATSAPAAPCLVKRYYGAADNGGSGADRFDAYRPWQFAPGLAIKDAQRTVNGQSSTWILLDGGPFTGADCFCFGATAGGHAKGNENRWAEFDIQRDSLVGYVWRDGGAPPAWIAADGWTLAGTVDAKNPDKGWGGMAPANKLYTKSFNAGRIAIKGPSDGTTVKVLPWVLFAEKDGAIPTKPANYDTPNQPCSQAYHDSFKTSDGKRPTWHPQIDYGRSHCYFEHEHGSDLSVITKDPAARPRYGEVMAVMGMTENHWGNKQYAVKVSDGKWLFILHHFGTTGVKRADTCLQRYHNVEIRLYNASGSERLAELRFAGDFGTSSGCQTGDNCDIPLDTATCPNGNRDTGYVNKGQGSRQLPVAPFGATVQSYEPWLVNLNGLLLGLSGELVINTPDGIDICDAAGCNNAVRSTLGTGTSRFLTLDVDERVINEQRVTVPFGIKATGQENANGYFWTDAFGKTLLTSSSTGAVRQFIKPGLNWESSLNDADIERGHMGGANAPRWGDPLEHVPTGVPGDAEGSIWAAVRRSQNPSSN